LQLRQDFLSELRVSTDVDLDEENGTSAIAVFLERFIRFVLDQKFSVDNDIATEQGPVHVLDALVSTFEEQVGRGDDVHTIVAPLSVSTENKNQIVSTIVRALHILGRNLNHRQNQDDIGSPTTALFRAVHDGKAAVYAIFGGQGTDNYFDSLTELYTTYEPLISPLIMRANIHLRHLIKVEKAYRVHFNKTLDVMDWLKKPENRPDSAYLSSAPVSFPLIGLVQFAAFEAVARLLSLSPAGMRAMLSGATGHSQGIVTAAVIAASTDWVSFHALCMKALTLLVSIGCRSQDAFSAPPARQDLAADASDNGEGVPSAMLSVRHLPLETIQKLVKEINSHLPPNGTIEIALHNGRTNFVLAGPPASLHGFNVRLRSIKAAPGQDQARVPFDRRKPRVSNRFLPITAPFHSSYLCPATLAVMQDMQVHNGLHIRGFDLRMPVYSTNAEGVDLCENGTDDIVPKIVRMITEEPLHWRAAAKLPGATHIVDFGPGNGGAGAGGLAHAMKEGSGVRVLNALDLHSEPSNSSFGGLDEILTRQRDAVVFGKHWGRENGPRLIRTAGDRVVVSTKMSQMLGIPPVMVAGMTPTTCSPDFVAAIINAGFHAEFATGGYHDPASLESALRHVAKQIPAGRGITCNVIYANPTALRWQIALLQRLKSEGVVPVEGLTFGAGVPSVDVANDYIATFPGLKHLGLKPGSHDAIRQVIAIAKANPSFPIILQWTGGRGGGHHSFEDFHEPIIHAYSEIRSQPNIVLVAGSGFGDVNGSYPYLTGQWAERFDLAVMPFDGILLGSRVMVTKEAKTSLEAKKAIVQAAGVDDAQWTGTYQSPTGGVLTVISEMGEPIHMLATRGVRLWAELDKTIFSVTDKAERAKRLREKKMYIIDKLNADYQKPWFGQSGGKAVDIEEMTFAEVITRMIELLFIRAEARWIHSSFRQLVFDFIRHAESRFINAASHVSELQSVEELNTPESCANRIFARYPQLSEELLGYQDAEHFIALSRRRGQKPVPFVPALDEHFETWFKKDSLWQSEDLAAVVGQDAGRICVLQGPVAAKHAGVVDEPIKDLLDSFHDGYIRRLTEANRGGDEFAVPYKECFGLPEVHTTENSARESDLVTRLQALGGEQNDWRRAFFTCKTIVQGGNIVENPVRRLFEQERSTLVQVDTDTDRDQVTVSLNEINSNEESVKVVEVRLGDKNIVEVRLFEHRTPDKQRAELLLLYKYCPERSFAPIHEVMEDRDERIRSFYRQIWFGSEPIKHSSIRDEFYSGPVQVTSHDIKQLANTLENLDAIFQDPLEKSLVAPMDFGIVAAWSPILQPLFAYDVQGDLLKLVHLSNGYRMAPNARPLAENDVVETSARVTAVVNQNSGKMIEVRGRISRSGAPVMDVTSQFLFRGTYTDYENTFQIVEEEPMVVELKSATDVAILKSKKWFQISESALQLLQPRSTLVFHLQTENQFGINGSIQYAKTTGWVEAKVSSKRLKRLGAVDYSATGTRSNLALSYLKRKGKPERARILFPTPHALLDSSDQVMIRMPSSNEMYANVSGDYNPIHVSKTLAKYVSLPGTITHGMYTSGRVRGVIEQHMHSASKDFFKSFHCTFDGMVLPGDELSVSLHHVGMIAGTQLIKVEASKSDGGEVVLRGEAEVDPPKTAYVFTGQGSQKVGMLEPLYSTSDVARQVWDRADKHFLDTYGKHNAPALLNPLNDNETNVSVLL
jgi:fatty acid synthase subunit beta, fungi type